jgi:hypothetical protein
MFILVGPVGRGCMAPTVFSPSEFRMSISRVRRTVVAVAISNALACAAAFAQDVTVTPPVGGGFAVNNASNVALFKIDANGNLAIAGLGGAVAQASPVCFDTVSGLVGPCATGGLVGPTGATGAAGPAGAMGATGPQGSTGPTGAAGATGVGAAGTTGATGAAGPAGATGATGAQGSTGTVGATGPQGAAGVTGATGAQGATGASGATGAQGAVGATGATGAQGPVGATGAQGSVGPAGATGATGAAGTVSSLTRFSVTKNPTVGGGNVISVSCPTGTAISGGCKSDPNNDLISSSYLTTATNTWTCNIGSSGGTVAVAEVYCTP